MSQVATESHRWSGAVVTIVHSPACHFCDDAEAALAALAEHYPLVVDRVDIHSDLGQALVREHRAPMSPLVLLDGTFFSFGRLPRRKLAALLEQRLGVGSAPARRRGQAR